MEYSAGNVSNLLRFVEKRETMRLLNTDSVDNVMNRVIDENVYQQKDLKRAKRQFNVKCFIQPLQGSLTRLLSCIIKSLIICLITRQMQIQI